MDEGLSRAVREAFVRWYDDGLIYRGERLVNWCPTDQTGLSDSEVEHEDVEGELVTFRYPLSDGTGSIACATTRVETMLGDTGIAVHPGDERYTDLIGKSVRHPFDGRELPIVADAAIDPAFGTGAVKVTPAHDPVDFDIAQRTGLPLMNIFGAGRDDQRERGRGVLRARALRRADRGAGSTGEARPDRRGDPPVRPLRGPLLPLPQRGRALDRGPAVVRRRRSVARAGEGGNARRPDHVLARTVAAGVRRLAGQPPGLEHLPAALVGPPDPGVVLPGRPRDRRPGGSRRLRHVWISHARAGPRRAGHVVLVAALALLDARVAGRHRGAAVLLPQHRARHRVRDPLPLGRPDDHVGHVASWATCRSATR